LKQVIDEGCNNVMSCEMVVTSTFRLAKETHRVEQTLKNSFKTLLLQNQNERHYKTTKKRDVT
jgi:hypothetical protein